MADQAQSLNPARRVSAETSAWLLLLGFFALFCVLIAGSGYFGWRYYNESTVPVSNTLLKVHVNAGVNYLTPDRTVAQAVERPTKADPCPTEPDICAFVAEGWRLTAKPEAGYGPVASLVLPDQSHVDMWAHPNGTSLALNRYQVSRWTQETQIVEFRQDSGYVRYDLASGQPYKRVAYTVVVSGGVQIELAPGGSYSISAPRAGNGQLRSKPVDVAPVLAEVAVRGGSAIVQSGAERRRIERGQMIAAGADGKLSEIRTAEWQLIADGGFTRHTTESYNTPGMSDTWVVNSNTPVEFGLGDRTGEFRRIKTCPPEKSYECAAEDQIFYGEFRREGDQRIPYHTGIEQEINADVSEYTKSLRLSATVSIIDQSVPLAGEKGSECPIMIRLTYKHRSPTDEQHEQVFCVYTGESETQVKEPGVRYERIPRFGFYRLDFDLRNDPNVSQLLRDAWFVQKIRIEARGHDYISQITNVSLVGTPK